MATDTPTDTPADLLAALAGVGVPVASVWDLVNGGHDYRAGVPVLLDWLTALEDRVEPGERCEALREGLVRALSVPAAKRAGAAPELLRQFRLVADDTGFGLRWAVGNALSVVADDKHYDGLATIAAERQWGPARQMVVQALGKSKDPRVVGLLRGLLDDDTVTAHAVIALGRQKDPAARADLERLLDDPRPLVRREAKKALGKLAP
ncbi:HEAT repeat domain-containing protein [Actinokineospora bangkokensis]|uniref:PBS lyase n=1 Tax=Actinokineospora bangkokensis TaxID=1193682 RepID=A0A1Q9LK43_9PSEU|nr:HEAT repeat domain-containing protein [Actinokineospora bangkokensis]OLR92373.1 hypothetical protein BJP25_19995 [Actinokineospora bangkokensis]